MSDDYFSIKKTIGLLMDKLVCWCGMFVPIRRRGGNADLPVELNQQRGFTLIELLVVIAIIVILASIVMDSWVEVRERAWIAKASSELNQLRTAITIMAHDTGMHPNHFNERACVGTTEIDLDLGDCAAGLGCTDGAFPGWAGPYMEVIEIDHWGGTYQFDPDYLCSEGVRGCPDNGWYRVVLSHGPNQSGTNAYDNDNIVQVICDCPTANCH